jgi:hypothetical protein
MTSKTYEDTVEEVVDHEALQQRLDDGGLHRSEKEMREANEVKWDWGGIPWIFEVFLRWISRVLNRRAKALSLYLMSRIGNIFQHVPVSHR